jgi:hypothetical protein
MAPDRRGVRPVVRPGVYRRSVLPSWWTVVLAADPDAPEPRYDVVYAPKADSLFANNRWSAHPGTPLERHGLVAVRLHPRVLEAILERVRREWAATALAVGLPRPGQSINMPGTEGVRLIERGEEEA